MGATAIVPVKRFSAAKQRLADALEPTDRALLAAAMAADVLAQIEACPGIERTIVVSGEPEVAALAARAGVDLVDDPGDAGHSEAALLGIDAALAGGARTVALLPGDCPLLEPAELSQALDELSQAGVVVIPDRHGSGTNGLLLSPPDAIAPSFGPDSRERHLRLAEQAGVAAVVGRVPSMGLDLDTGKDLLELRTHLSNAGPEIAPQTTSALTTIVAAIE